MWKLKSAAAWFVAIALWCSPAIAQTNPNLRQGQVLTPAQWNTLFASKQDTLGYTPLNVAGGIMTGRLVTAAPSTLAGLNLSPGSAPASPVNGDMWSTSTGVFARINGVTVGPFVSTATVALTVGSTPISGGTTTRILRNNAGVLGEYTITGSGTVVAMQTSPAFVTPALGVAIGTSLALAGCTIGALDFCTNGTANFGGSVTLNGASALGAGQISGVNNQNASTQWQLTNTSTGVSALASFATFNSISNASFGLASTGYTGIAPLANRAFVFSNTGVDGIILYTSGAKAIDAYINGSRVGGWTTGGLFTLNSPLDVPSGGSGRNTLTSNAFLTGNGNGTINMVAITGLVLGNGASAPTAYAGTSCTNQFPTALSALGAATCASITNAFLTAGSFTSITGVGTLTAGATGAGFTVALTTSTITGTLPGANFGPLTSDVTTSSYVATIANNAVTNAKAAQMAAFTFKGNVTGSTANATDWLISGLTHKSSPASTDLLIISDEAASHATKYTTIAEAVGALASGVSSIDAKTGAFTTSNGLTSVVNDLRLAAIATGRMLANVSGGSAVPVATKLPYIARASASFTTDATSTTETVYHVVLTGGGGGSGGANGAVAAAGGGGAGGTCIGTFSGVAAGATVTIVAGAGGAAGGVAGNGSTGSSSTIAATGMTTITATGGNGGGGTSSSVASPGVGGTCTTGTSVKSITGGSGMSGNAGSGATLSGGIGGTSYFGGGANNPNAALSCNPVAGAAPGSGASGACSTGLGGAIGAAGTAEVTWNSVQ